MKQKKIKIKCEGAGMIDLAKLVQTQGELKTITEANLAKLKLSIAKKGFIAPFFLWKQRENRFRILDGHQRKAALDSMLDEGWILEGNLVPYGLIEASSLADAKDKLLALTSRYGDFTQHGFMKFTSDFKFDDSTLRLGKGEFIFKDLEAREAQDEISERRFPLEEIVDDATKFFLAEGAFRRPENPVFMQKQIINRMVNLPEETQITSDLGAVVANQYHPEMLEIGVSGRVTYAKATSTEKFIRRAISLHTRMDKEIPLHLSCLQISGGTQIVNQFRPAYYMYLCNRYGKRGTVLDPCAGWGGRLVGFIGSDCKRYYATDPCDHVVQHNREIAEALGAGKKIQIEQTPFEDYKHRGAKADLVATCPPYFKKELYHGDDQSHIRYPVYEQWVEGFLAPLCANSYRASKPDATLVLIVGGELKIGAKQFPFVDDTIRCALDAGWKEREKFEYPLTTRKVRTEGTDPDSEFKVLNRSDSALVFSKENKG